MEKLKQAAERPFLNKDEEDALVARAAGHDTAATTEIFERYQGVIEASLRRILGRARLAEDGRGAANVALMEAIYDYEATPTSHFAALAASRVRAALVSVLRRERRDWEYCSHPEQDERASDYWEAHGGVEAAERGPEAQAVAHGLVEQALGCLSRREREILFLIYMADIKQDDVCTRLQVSANSLSRTKSRVLARLRRELAEQPGTPKAA